MTSTLETALTPSPPSDIGVILYLDLDPSANVNLSNTNMKDKWCNTQEPRRHGHEGDLIGARPNFGVRRPVWTNLGSSAPISMGWPRWSSTWLAKTSSLSRSALPDTRLYGRKITSKQFWIWTFQTLLTLLTSATPTSGCFLHWRLISNNLDLTEVKIQRILILFHSYTM